MKRTSVISFFVENHILWYFVVRLLWFEIRTVIFSFFTFTKLNPFLSPLLSMNFVFKKTTLEEFFGFNNLIFMKNALSCKKSTRSFKNWRNGSGIYVRHWILLQVEHGDFELTVPDLYKCLVSFSTDRDYCMRQGYLFANFLVRIQCIRKGVSLFACHVM